MKKRRGWIWLSSYLALILIIRFGFGPYSEVHWFTYELVHNAILFFIPFGFLLVLLGLWKRKMLVGAIIALVASWLTFTDPVLRLPSADPKEKDLRLITYNIAHGLINLPAVISDLRRLDADVICLQETGFGDKEKAASAETIAKELGYEHHVQKTGNSVLSRYPFDLQHVVDVPTKWATKEFPEVLIQTPKGPIRVISVHLEPSWIAGWPPQLKEWNPTLSKVVRDRRSQLQMLLSRVRQSKEPIIVAGDFNGPPYTEIPIKFGQEMTDSFAAVGSGCGMTLLASFPYQRIDYAFAKGIRPTRAQVVESRASDHMPVVFEYQMVAILSR